MGEIGVLLPFLEWWQEAPLPPDSSAGQDGYNHEGDGRILAWGNFALTGSGTVVWRQSVGHSRLKTLLHHPVLSPSDGRDAKSDSHDGQKASAESYDSGTSTIG